MIDGIDGKISSENGLWYFSLFESLTDGKGSLTADTAVQILPSSMLEKLADAVSTDLSDEQAPAEAKIFASGANSQNTRIKILFTFHIFSPLPRSISRCGRAKFC